MPLASIADQATLDDRLSAPSPAVIEPVGRGQGDLLVVGVGGKMGPAMVHRQVTLAELRAFGVRKSLFSARWPPWIA